MLGNITGGGHFIGAPENNAGSHKLDRHRVVLGKVKTAEKSKEISAIPDLLNLQDCLVTMGAIGAMGCQKTNATQVLQKGADYLLSVKENQPALADTLRQHSPWLG